MNNPQKAKLITPWINPEERISVDFTDVQGLTAQVLECTEHVVHLSFLEGFPHMKERVTIPLGEVQVGEDRGHYTRDPKTPLRWGRLLLRVDHKHPDNL